MLTVADWCLYKVQPGFFCRSVPPDLLLSFFYWGPFAIYIVDLRSQFMHPLRFSVWCICWYCTTGIAQSELFLCHWPKINQTVHMNSSWRKMTLTDGFRTVFPGGTVQFTIIKYNLLCTIYIIYKLIFTDIRQCMWTLHETLWKTTLTGGYHKDPASIKATVLA